MGLEKCIRDDSITKFTKKISQANICCEEIFSFIAIDTTALKNNTADRHVVARRSPFFPHRVC